MVKKIMVNLPDLSGNNVEESAIRKIDIISNQVKVGNTVRELSSALAELKVVSCAEEKTEVNKNEKLWFPVMTSILSIIYFQSFIVRGER